MADDAAAVDAGISKETHDRVSNELAEAQRQLSMLRAKTDMYDAQKREALTGMKEDVSTFINEIHATPEFDAYKHEIAPMQRWAAESGGLSCLVRAGVGERRARVLTKAFKEQGFETEEDFSLLRDGDLLSDAALRSRDIGMRDHEVRKLRAAAAATGRRPHADVLRVGDRFHAAEL